MNTDTSKSWVGSGARNITNPKSLYNLHGPSGGDGHWNILDTGSIILLLYDCCVKL
jgi:hypothetical protein